MSNGWRKFWLSGAVLIYLCILFHVYFELFFCQVDIFDTCGDFQFPAMRRLSIATAHAFLLVYSTLSSESFTTLKRCFEEIRQQRSDFQNIPIVVAGNKVDLAAEQRQVHIEDVSEWLYCDLPKLRWALCVRFYVEIVFKVELFRH